MSGLLPYDDDAWARLDDGLRFYQRDIAQQALVDLQTHRSVLVVAATGMGKTQIFGGVAADWRGKVLVLAHRDELVDQARRRLEQMTGEWVQIEQGQFRAELTTRLVVASVDTMRQPKRLERFPKDHFSLIIVDEAHHYVGNTYVRPLDYFHDAKVLGVTATPDRADEKAMGQTFGHVSAVLDIEDGIDLGYLVPIRGQLVTLDEIDISHVGKTGRDLAAGQLDEAMVKAVEGVVRETLRLEPGRQGIAFFPGVKSAEYAAEKFNILKPDSARFLSGQTPTDERRRMVSEFRKGNYQYLCNCMVATEGFDAPGASLIVLARPTLSRALYAQMIGRGTRTLPGVVDRYHARDAAAVRREAIRTSAKPDCMVLDFVGNSGRHALVTLEDVLGGKYTDEEVATAKKKRAASGGDPRAALEAARAELKAIAAASKAKVKSTVSKFDPFAALRVERDSAVDVTGGKPVSQGQWDFLTALGIPQNDIAVMTSADAQKLIAAAQKRRQLKLASFRQLRTLAKYGFGDPNISARRASAALDYIASQGWGRSGRINPSELHRIATGREPGEEG